MSGQFDKAAFLAAIFKALADIQARTIAQRTLIRRTGAEHELAYYGGDQ